MNIIALANLYNNKIASILFLLFVPQLYYLKNIKKNNYSNDSIQTYMKKTDQTLIAVLLYIITLTR
jgi:hypothetical protein